MGNEMKNYALLFESFQKAAEYMITGGTRDSAGILLERGAKSEFELLIKIEIIAFFGLNLSLSVFVFQVCWSWLNPTSHCSSTKGLFRSPRFVSTFKWIHFILKKSEMFPLFRLYSKWTNFYTEFHPFPIFIQLYLIQCNQDVVNNWKLLETFICIQNVSLNSKQRLLKISINLVNLEI